MNSRLQENKRMEGCLWHKDQPLPGHSGMKEHDIFWKTSRDLDLLEYKVQGWGKEYMKDDKWR